MARPSGGHGAVEIGTSEEVHGRFPPRLHADRHAFLPVHPGHFFVAYNDTERFSGLGPIDRTLILKYSHPFDVLK